MMNTHPARGMRDFLPEDVRRREHVIGVIEDVYTRYGFEPLETPAVENLETLTGKYGEEGDRLIFKILKRGEHARSGEADLALRYDLTVPLARVVAEYHGKLPRFFKRFQIQPVWRADRPQRGRFREFYQCDVDVTGSRSPVVEAELCAAASEALARLGFENFVIRLNHRQLLSGILAASGVPLDHHADALIALDKLDKTDREGVAGELANRGIAGSSATALLDFLSAGDADAGRDNSARLRRVREFVLSGGPGALSSDGTLDAIANLARVVELCELHGAGNAARRFEVPVRIDPALARGLSYYTGAIMEIAVPDLAGSLGGGGRYDGLVGMFLGQEVPACGFSLGLERIIVVMTERGMFPPELQARPADAMVTLWSDATAGEALALAADLRAAGLRVDVYPEPDKLGRQFKYAAGRNIPLVAVLGEDELSRGAVAIKDLRTGEQQSVSRASAASVTAERLARRAT